MDLSFSNLSCQPVRIYKHPDLEKDKTRKFSNSVNYVYVTPDLKYLIAGYLSGQIIIFDYITGKLRYSYKPHSRKVIHLEYYEPERILLSTGADGRICLFELETFEFIQEIVQPDLKGYEHLNEIRFVLVDEYMKYLFFGSNNGCLYQCNKDNRYRPEILVSPKDTYPAEPYYLTSGIFAQEFKEEMLIYASGYSLKAYSFVKQKVVKIIGETNEYINDVVQHPGVPNIFITWSQDGTITYWDFNTSNKLFSFQTGDPEYTHLSISPDGRFLASGSDGNNVNIINLDTKHHALKIQKHITKEGQIIGHSKIVKTLKFVDNNHLVTGSYDNTIILWEIS